MAMAMELSSPAVESAIGPPSMTTKRKRDGPMQTAALGELYVDISPRKKKARFDPEVDSVDTASDAQSYAESNPVTGPTETPLTAASSARSKTKKREKKWPCTWPGCDKTFDRPVRLQSHINSHTGERPHACEQDDCDKTFYKLEHLRRHVQEKHSDKVFACEFQTWNPISGKKEACGKTFPSQQKLKRHIAIHEEKDETTCSWEGCGQVFRKQDTLQRHIRKDHLGEAEYVCSRELSNGEECGEAFEKPWQLKSHEAKEHNAPKYWCELCAYARPSDLDDLQPVIVNDLDPEFLPGPEDLKEDLDPVMMDTLSLDETSAKVASTGAVGFVTYHELQRHLRDVHPPTCSECGKICKSRRDLTAHMEIEHANNPEARRPAERKFLCPYEGCERAQPGNGFTKKGNIPQHIKSAHTKEKNFVCGEYDLGQHEKLVGWNGVGCGLALGTKQSLIGHVRTQHMGLPAMINKRTGLKSTRTRRKKAKNGYEEDFINDEDDEDDVEKDYDALPDFQPDSVAPNRALSMLTGYGYEEMRPYVCLLAHCGCQMRFGKEYELAYHMEMTHEWNADDINEALADVDNFAPMDVQERVLGEMLIMDMKRNAGDALPVDPRIA